MTMIFTLLTILALASQDCWAQMAQQPLGEELAENKLGLHPNTEQHIQGVEAALNYAPTAPIMKLLINGIYSLLLDPVGEKAFEDALEDLQTITKSERALQLFDYVLSSIAQALDVPEVRNVILKKVKITNEVFKNDGAKVFVHQGIQTSYRLLTDYEVLRTLRQCMRGAVKVLTDPSYQNRIAKSLRSLMVILKDPEALSYVEQTLKALNRILSSERAKGAIEMTVGTLKNTVGALSDNNAKRIGKMQERLAQPRSMMPGMGYLNNLFSNYQG